LLHPPQYLKKWLAIILDRNPHVWLVIKLRIFIEVEAIHRTWLSGIKV
jgi:hypothetical protein